MSNLSFYPTDNVTVYLDVTGNPIVKNFYLDDVRFCKRFVCPNVLVYEYYKNYRYTRICKIPSPYNVYVLQSKLIDGNHWQTIQESPDKTRIVMLAKKFLSQHPNNDIMSKKGSK